MQLEPAEAWVESCFSKVRSAKLNTDVTILMPGKDYLILAKPQLNKGHIPWQHDAEITQSHAFTALI